ncbi:type II toxin-antitoxin system VapB family antitoxin [Streptomyces sp. NPDC093225]|uniref:type II toxin-antitoxin system VapB family antitoxin n=1 Tax=Streptomyces sp. NPDC093225 TaxID=3366034 RepID=UPI00381DD0E4
MSVIRIDIDDHALAEALRTSSIRSESELVNLALRQYNERRRRDETRSQGAPHGHDRGADSP